ncbi:AMP-dependent synthetase/ligase [Desulfogranum mediterraneum]|uniref:AMP-dependent synthetase/ligase n=1 Tax=Desulfogranum mediterraneum TaxID=160661 RepID=UPI00040C4087|nr:long-chain fatty acid--CoA ligase [Desulfogranum mediterraneum]
MHQATDYITPNQVQTIHELFLERVARTPEQIAYRFFDHHDSSWQELSWQAMQQRLAGWYTALRHERLNPGDRVALMLANSPEWACFDLAALALGLVVVPLFANDRPENIAYILEATQSRVLLCPGLAYWKDLDPVLHRLQHIQTIVTLDHCRPQDQETRIICASDWLNRLAEPIAPRGHDGDTLASIVFTSGTTGPPKGVMLSHRNILENSYAGLEAIAIYPDDLFLSFLPMSHMLERTVGYYLAIMAGATVAFARSIPQLAEDIQQLQPTALIAVPRIFERIHARIEESLQNRGPLARTLFALAVKIGWSRFRHAQGRQGWRPELLLHPLLDRLIGSKVRAQLGGRMRVIISGGAPLSPKIAQCFIGLGLPLFQGYGLTETSPVVSVNRPERNEPSTVGPPLPGVEVRVGSNDELLVRGSCVMLGYWKNPEATAEIIDDQGWLHTGDKAMIREGLIRITGRLKEIIVMSNSEKVAPVDLELAVATDPLLEQVMVVGEGRPYLTMVAVLNRKHWNKLCAELKLPYSEASLGSETVQQAVLSRVEARLTPFPGFAWIKEVALTLEPWTVENGLLTPTLKIKREQVAARMEPAIKAMYQASSPKPG